MRKQYIWMACMPLIFGYGLIVVDKTEELALKALKKEYYKWRKFRNGHHTFKQAYENWSGRSERIELGKVYNEDFS